MVQLAALGTNMSLLEKKQQSQLRLEQASAIEQKYMDAAMPQAEDEQVKKLLSEVDRLEAEIQAEEERKGRQDHIARLLDVYQNPIPPPQHVKSDGKLYTPGEMFTRDAAYLDLKNRGIFNSSLNRTEFGVQFAEGTSLLRWATIASKTLLFGSSATSGGPLVNNDIQAGVLQYLQREINVLDMIPRLQTTSDTIEYVSQSSPTLAAAFTAEATGNARTGTDGTKPESALSFTTVTAAVKTLAHWLPVTNRMLADAAQIRGFIDSQLLLGLMLTLEQQVLTGDGTGENLTGILNTSNVNVLAKGTDNEVDALFKARTIARTAGKVAPNAIVMNPADYQQVRLLRENASTATLGQYLMGPPNTLGVPTVWGIPVIESENITADTVLVGNFQQATIFDREQASVRVGTINEQFIRNIQTILAEQRLAFVVWRPAAFTKITGY